MPKDTINWTAAIEAMREPLAPEVHYAVEIESEVERMEGLILRMQRQRQRGARLLVGFSRESGVQADYTRHQAFLDVLDNHGLLEAYYDPESYEDCYTRETTSGGLIHLQAPGTQSAFTIHLNEANWRTRVIFAGRV